jgi:hypothetical protein
MNRKNILYPLFINKLFLLYGAIFIISCEEGNNCEMNIFENCPQKYSDSTTEDVFHLFESDNCFLFNNHYYKKVFIIRQNENDTIMNLLIRKDLNPNYYLVFSRYKSKEDTIYFNFQNVNRVSVTMPQLTKRDNTFSEYNFFVTSKFKRYYYFRINDKGQITKIWSEKYLDTFITL